MHKRTFYLKVDLEIRDDEKLLTEVECRNFIFDLVESGSLNNTDRTFGHVGIQMEKYDPNAPAPTERI